MGPLSFSVLAVFATWGGGFLILRQKAWAEKHLWRFLAFGSGILLAMTFLHLLPEAWALNARATGVAVVVAFVILLAVEQFTVVHACGEVGEHCTVHRVGHGALVALFLHSLADGLAIAFSFVSSRFLGFAVASAVIAHKFSDGMTLSTLFLDSGHSHRATRNRVVVLSLATPLGVVLGMASGGWASGTALAALLGLAAGGFLYISMADILPRIHKSRDRWCWVLLVAGVVVSVLLPHP
ncbi:MAG: ZIP family metal transporter [Elusimicrobia bacterium]|jgi:zinc and cadmium transporter|nr:ZIP family metal transporter [Elusimicrobiota bacterium]